MFGGSDERALREKADESQVVNVLMKNMVELEFANDLKLYEIVDI